MDSATPNEPKSSGRARKRKLDESKGPENQADRKRAQNRISQQCFREKQQAYVRYLESFVEAIKSGYECNDDDSRYAKLMTAHLELLEENRRTQDALLRLRQKLLGISNSAFVAAEDPIFETMLRGDMNRDATGDESSTSPIPTVIQDDPKRSGSKPKLPRSPEKQSGLTFESNPSDVSSALKNVDDFLVQGAARADNNKPVASAVSRQLNSNSEISSQLRDGAATFETETQIPHWATDTRLMDLSYMFSTTHESYGMSSITHDQSVVINSPWVFAEKVEIACKRYMSQSIQQLQSSRSNMPIQNTKNNSGSRNPMQMKLIRQVSSAAVELMGAYAGLTSYIYGVNFSTYMEHILLWRMCNTTESRLAIPEPLQPTPLQYTSMSHPMVIDFFNWPIIRDQAILHMNELDIDALARDIVLNTVVEIPDKKICINVYEAAYKTGLSTVGKKSALEDPGWVFVQVAPNSPFSLSLEPAEDVLVHELSCRIRNCDLETSQTRAVGDIPVPTPRTTEASQIQWGGLKDSIDEIKNWKLSKEFAKKWTRLDCSSVLSTYDMVKCPSNLC